MEASARSYLMPAENLAAHRPRERAGDEASILPLRLERVTYTVRRRTLLQDVSLTLSEGAHTIVLGSNGAGKSLLLRLCHGLLTPSAGTVEWQGSGHGRIQGRHAVVFQRPTMLRRSVRANVTYPLALAGQSWKTRRERADQALKRFGLAPLARRPARVLSGGEQQRLSMARAWALAPQVLFLDEPTANLDPQATRAIEEMIRAFRDTGTKTVMATHDMAQARRLAGEVVFLHHGRLLEQTPAERFFAQPRTPEAAAFVRGELLN